MAYFYLALSSLLISGDYPPAPQKYHISEECLDSNIRNLLHKQKYKIRKDTKTGTTPTSSSKLCVTLLPKKYYVCTLQNLLLFTSLGLQVTK